jgi:hypothetical protein
MRAGGVSPRHINCFYGLRNEMVRELAQADS